MRDHESQIGTDEMEELGLYVLVAMLLAALFAWACFEVLL